jgi:hypothetical protein
MKLVEDEFRVLGCMTLMEMLNCCAWVGLQLKVVGVFGPGVLVGVSAAPAGAPPPRLQNSGSLIAVVVLVRVTGNEMEVLVRTEIFSMRVRAKTWPIARVGTPTSNPPSTRNSEIGYRK